MELGEEGREKENARASMILKHTTSVQVEDIKICIKSC
jgi:hypothetical protein